MDTFHPQGFLGLNENQYATFITGEFGCWTIEVTFSGEILEKEDIKYLSRYQGLYNRSDNVCGNPSWSHSKAFSLVRIWWHPKSVMGEECGGFNPIFKGKGKDYWKIGNFLDEKTSFSNFDTFDASPSVTGPPYGNRRDVWSWYDRVGGFFNGSGWTGPTPDIKVECILFANLG